jgi:hypothetical protein
MLEALLAVVVYVAPYVSGLLIVVALIGVYANFREARRAPYFRFRRAAGTRGWRWVLVLLVSIVVFVVSLRSRGSVSPPDFGAWRAVPTPTLLPTAATVLATLTPGGGALPTPSLTETLALSAPTTMPTPSVEMTQARITPLVDAVLEITDISSDVSPGGEPVNIGATFPAGLPRIYVWYRYDHMTDRVSWSRALFSDGVQIRSEVGEWEAGESGVGYYYFSAQDGWTPGQYEVQFTIGDQLADFATFTITGP